MLRSIFMCLLAGSLFVSTPAFAAGGGEAAAAEDEESANVRAVEMLGVVVPVERDGRLINYLFVSLRLHIADGHDPWKYREKGHILRHEILRAAHKETVGREGHPMELDEEKAIRIMSDALAPVMGEGALERIEFIGVDSLKIFTTGSNS